MLRRFQRADKGVAEVAKAVAEKGLQSSHSRKSSSPGLEDLGRHGPIEGELAVGKLRGSNTESLAFECRGQSPADAEIIATLLERLVVELLNSVARSVRSRLVAEQIIDVDKADPGIGLQEGAPAGKGSREGNEVGSGEAAPDPIEAGGQRKFAQVLPLELGIRGARPGGRQQFGITVDDGDYRSAGGEFGGDITRAAAQIENPLAACDRTPGEGMRPVAPGKLAAVLFD